jgi:hypothetical protein
MGNTTDINRAYQQSCGNFYQGLVLVQRPKIDLSQRYDYFEIDQDDEN